MKITLTPPPQIEPKPRSFPILMRSKSLRAEGRVVLFTSERTGVVLHDPKDPTINVGWSSTSWVSMHDTSTWEPFTGKLTLEND